MYLNSALQNNFIVLTDLWALPLPTPQVKISKRNYKFSVENSPWVIKEMKGNKVFPHHSESHIGIFLHVLMNMHLYTVPILIINI